MQKNELAQLAAMVRDAIVIGPVKGVRHWMFDGRAMLARPDALALAARGIIDQLPADIDVFATCGLGGMPLATAVQLFYPRRATLSIVRKELDYPSETDADYVIRYAVNSADAIATHRQRFDPVSGKWRKWRIRNLPRGGVIGFPDYDGYFGDDYDDVHPQRWVEGAPIAPGARVWIIDDSSNKGRTYPRVKDAILASYPGADIAGMSVLVDYGRGSLKLREQGVDFRCVIERMTLMQLVRERKAG